MVIIDSLYSSALVISTINFWGNSAQRFTMSKPLKVLYGQKKTIDNGEEILMTNISKFHNEYLDTKD